MPVGVDADVVRAVQLLALEVRSARISRDAVGALAHERARHVLADEQVEVGVVASSRCTCSTGSSTSTTVPSGVYLAPHVARHVGEEEVLLARVPDRPLREREAGRELLDLRAFLDELVDRVRLRLDPEACLGARHRAPFRRRNDSRSSDSNTLARAWQRAAATALRRARSRPRRAGELVAGRRARRTATRGAIDLGRRRPERRRRWPPSTARRGRRRRRARSTTWRQTRRQWLGRSRLDRGDDSSVRGPDAVAGRARTRQRPTLPRATSTAHAARAAARPPCAMPSRQSCESGARLRTRRRRQHVASASSDGGRDERGSRLGAAVEARPSAPSARTSVSGRPAMADSASAHGPRTTRPRTGRP